MQAGTGDGRAGSQVSLPIYFLTLLIVPSSQLYTLAPEREKIVADAIGKWAFPAHDLSDDELVHAGCLMLQHVLSMPELERWRLSSGK